MSVVIVHLLWGVMYKYNVSCEKNCLIRLRLKIFNDKYYLVLKINSNYLIYKVFTLYQKYIYKPLKHIKVLSE